MKESFLRTKPIFILLIKLGIPMMISMFINSIYNIVDSIYIARIGTEAVTALSIIFPLQNLTVAISVGLGIGINSVVARVMGSGEKSKAEKVATIGILLAIINSFIFILIAFTIVPLYLSFYAPISSEIYSWSIIYGQIVLGCSLPYLIFLVYEKLFQSLGWMKTSMCMMLVGAITNIILDPILIFGYFSFPALGITGAAVATVLSQFIAFIIGTLICLFSNFPIRFHLKYFKFDKEVIFSIYNVGIPAAITLALPSISIGVLNGILVNYSSIAVATLGLYYKVQTFFYMPLSGLCQGMRPLASYNYGAKEYIRVRKTFYEALTIGIIILGIGYLTLQFFPNLIMNLFDSEIELYNQGIKALRVISIGFIASVFPVISNGIFEALGLGLQSLIISLLRQVILLIPLAYFLSLALGINGVWWSFPIAEIIVAVISIYMVIYYFIKLGIGVNS